MSNSKRPWPFPFKRLTREPDMLYQPGEVPLECVICGVELINLHRPICGRCFQQWQEAGYPDHTERER